jgi:hypothetical protein
VEPDIANFRMRPFDYFRSDYSNIEPWTVMERGDHFAAIAQPDVLAEDMRSFGAASCGRQYKWIGIGQTQGTIQII